MFPQHTCGQGIDMQSTAKRYVLFYCQLLNAQIEVMENQLDICYCKIIMLVVCSLVLKFCPEVKVPLRYPVTFGR